MIGARRRTSSTGTRSPFAPRATVAGSSPDSNSSRIVANPSITVICPSVSAPGRVGEPANGVAGRRLAEHPLMAGVDRLDHRVLFVDLRPRRGHEHLVLDLTVGMLVAQRSHQRSQLALGLLHAHRRRDAYVEE